MDEDDGPTPAQLGEHRFKAGIAQVDAVAAGPHHDAVGVGQRQQQRGEQPEPPGVVPYGPCPGPVLVDLAGRRAGRGRVAEIRARGRHRQHAGLDARAVH
ncbi:hypothetical protein SUDANB178_00597 [Streptomyces sp. enrichment culture]